MIFKRREAVIRAIFAAAVTAFVFYGVRMYHGSRQTREFFKYEVKYRQILGINCLPKPVYFNNHGRWTDDFIGKTGLEDLTHLKSNTPSSINCCGTDLQPGLVAIRRPPPVLLSSRDVSGSRLNEQLLLSPYQVRWHNESKGSNINDNWPNSLKPIPKIIHYVHIARSFTLVNYLSIRAAFLRIIPDAIYFHCYKEPSDSTYYKLSKQMITKIIIHKPIGSVFGRPVRLLEHQADVLRLMILLKYGGIYIDTDVIPLKSFDYFLNHQKPVTMGYERTWPVKKIPNAILIGQRNSSFLYQWFQEYKTFDDSDWALHSVKIPIKLARKYPNEINVENVNTFFYPTYHSIIPYFRSNNMKEKLKDSYAVHLWNHINKKYLQSLTPSLIYDCDIGLNEVLRPLIPSPFISFLINLDKGFHVSELLDTIIGIAQQGFSLWEILTSVYDLKEDICYYSSKHSSFNLPHYSCNITALAAAYGGTSTDLRKISGKLANILGRKSKGSIFSRLRCGSIDLNTDIIKVLTPSVVKFEDQSNLEPLEHQNVMETLKLKKDNSVIPRGVWLINVRVGEVLPSDFLDQVFEALNKKNWRRSSLNVNIRDKLTGKDYLKKVQFIFAEGKKFHIQYN